MRSVRRFIPSFIIVSCLLAPSLATAQPSDRGPRLAGTVSGAFGDGGPAPSFDLSAGYRFTSRPGVEINGAYLDGLDFGQFPVCPMRSAFSAAPIRSRGARRRSR